MMLFYSIISLLEASIIHNVKVVPNGTFEFGSEKVKDLLVPIH